MLLLLKDDTEVKKASELEKISHFPGLFFIEPKMNTEKHK